MSSSSPRLVSRRIPDTTERMWRTASTMLPEPASPFVLIIAAPSPIRRSASPRSRAPHTNGTLNANLSTWKCSSAGVSTSDSSMKSTPSASRICASTKWPIRHFAITGIDTVDWISLIFLTGDMRATPSSLRISDGTRSSAITATAPASSAIFACSALVTSMMTPPFSISANPTFNRGVPTSMLVPSFDCELCALLSQRIAQIGDQIVGILQPDRDTDEPRADSLGELLLFRDTTVRRARGIRPGRRDVAEARRELEELRSPHEALYRERAPGEIERHHRALKAWEQLLCQRVLRVRRQPRIVDSRDARSPL